MNGDADPAPVLPPNAVAQTKRIAEGIRRGEVAPLVGAGLSFQCGLPLWEPLVKRLILAWRWWGPSPAHGLPAEAYVQRVRAAFLNDLEVVSYLRRSLQRRRRTSFGQLLYEVLYEHRDMPGELFTPQPNHLHRHAVAMVARYPRRIWTTNYDDLLEEAARQAGEAVRTLDPIRRGTGPEITVAHLHGFMPPEERRSGHPLPREAPVILAEDDFQAVAADVVGWTSREFLRLFDEHSVLMLGLSMDDQNLRRALSFAEQRAAAGREHFAVMRTVSRETRETAAMGRDGRGRGGPDPNRLRSAYWRMRGVTIVEIPGFECLLPFLARLRYESFGEREGDLWREGARLGYEQFDPWRPGRQAEARRVLSDAANALAENLGFPGSEIVEIGVFLLKPDGRTLELVFRGGGEARAERGGREFSANPDAPTGVAGRVFASGDLVRIPRDHPLHDYNVPDSQIRSVAAYEGIIAAPIVDWRAGGIPIGVIYLTTTTSEGALFRVEDTPGPGLQDWTLGDIYDFLADVANTLFEPWRVR